MKKVLIVIPGGNKGKFITDGFADAFKHQNFFVFKRPYSALNTDEISHAAPGIIFIYWTETLAAGQFILPAESGAKYIHVSEKLSNIPEKFYNIKNHYIFASDCKDKKRAFIHAVSSGEYQADFKGYKYKITFAGNPSKPGREEILAALIKNFGAGVNIFCPADDFDKSLKDIKEKKLLSDEETELYKKSYKGYVNKQKELAGIYVSSIVNIDMKSSMDISYRFLEITASGGFVTAPYSEVIKKRYNNGKDAETYRNTDELIEKTAFYLKHVQIAGDIAINGKVNTISSYNCYDRLEKMMKAVYGKNFNCRR